MNPQNQMKAFIYLVGGTILLIMWHIISVDINIVLQNAYYGNETQGDVLDVLWFKYGLIGAGGALFSIGAIAFIIHFYKKIFL